MGIHGKFLTSLLTTNVLNVLYSCFFLPYEYSVIKQLYYLHNKLSNM
jgi:hypothetical protein